MRALYSSLDARWRSQPPVRRELLLVGAGLALGLLLLPLVIWIFGRIALGAYANGGPFSLWLDFLRGLVQGAGLFWVVALGPYLLIVLIRVFTLLWRRATVM